MSHRVLRTGASGYLGGSLLASLDEAYLPQYDLYCLVRTDEKKKAVQSYGSIPVELDLQDKEAVTKFIVDNRIDIVYFLIDAIRSVVQEKLITALGELKSRSVRKCISCTTKFFSEFADFNSPNADDDPNLYDVQNKAQAEPEAAVMVNCAVKTTCTVIERSEELGVKSIVFSPCIFHGEGEGFRNRISIQTVAVVKAAPASKRVYKVDQGHPSWPVSHISDTIELHISILHAILKGQNVPNGKQGYYLASSGNVVWNDLYKAMVKRLHERGVIESDEVTLAGQAELQKMAEGLKSPSNMVRVQLGGQCSFIAKNGANVGWKSEHPPQYIVETAAEEVDLILANLRAHMYEELLRNRK